MSTIDDGVNAALDEVLLAKITSSNNQSRLQAHATLVEILQALVSIDDPVAIAAAFKLSDPAQLDRLVEGVALWLASSNFKIALNGLEVLLLLLHLLKSGFRHFLPGVVPAVIDRLGDAKDQVREMAQTLLLDLMEISSPQYVFERLAPNAFQHKLWRVREEAMICVCNTLNTYGAASLSLSKFVPFIIKLVSDAQGPVRDQAVLTLVEIYRHVGERVRTDLTKKAAAAGIPEARLRTITARFDEVRDAGQMVADIEEVPPFKSYADEPEAAPTPSSTSSAGSSREHTFARPVQPVVAASTAKTPARLTSGSGSRATIRAGSAHGGFPKSDSVSGATNEDEFLSAFEDVQRVQIYSAKDLEESMRQVKDVLADGNLDWEKRVVAIKRLRGVVLAEGHTNFPDEFFLSLRTLENPFMTTVKDLRSQVVREACVTIAYLSQSLASKFDHFAEMVLPTLICQLPSSAKIMATSASTAIRFIIVNTFSTKLVPIFISNLSSKSAEIRRRTSEFLDLLLKTWETHFLERHQGTLSEALKKGLSDADAETRAFCRKAFWSYRDHFQDQADALMNSLEPSKQKQLQSELTGSTSRGSLAPPSSSRSRSAARPATTHRAGLGGQGASAAPVSQRPGTSGSSRVGGGVVGVTSSPSSSSLASSRARSASNDRILDEKPAAGRSVSSMGAVRRPIKHSVLNGRQSSAPQPRTSSDDSEGIDSMEFPLDFEDGGDGEPQSTLFHRNPVKRSNSAADILDEDEAPRPAPSMAPSAAPARKSRGPAQRIERRASATKASSSASPSAIPSIDDRGRARSRVGVSQSQPGSRSGSPGSATAHLSYGFSMDTSPGKGIGDQTFSGLSFAASPCTPTGTPGSGQRSGPRRSRIPRSANASRESSPSRLGFSAGRDRRLSSGSTGGTPLSAARRNYGANRSGSNRSDPLAQRVLTYDKDSEAAISDLLTRGGAGALSTRRPRFDSDDDASETSSVSGSERSFGSTSRPRGGEDVNEVFNNLCSASWAERKEGLLQFNAMMHNGRYLNRTELKKTTEIFTRMFHDHHQKVLSLFLETLVGFLEIYKEELLDWLYVLLLRLLHRMGTDLLSSAMAKVTRALETVRDVFPTDHQWKLVTRFLVDSTQTPNMKVKMATMTYMHSLCSCMDPSDMTNTQDTRMALSRIIQWTTEPKSGDVRRASQLVVVAFFDLNPSVMSSMLNQLPKSYQDGAHKLIETHLKTSQPSTGLEGSKAASPLSAGSGGSGSRGFSPRGSMSPRTSVTAYQPPRSRSPGNPLDEELENLNPEDIHDSIRQTTRQIANLSLNTHDDAFLAELGKEQKAGSQDSGIGPAEGDATNKHHLQQLNVNGVAPRTPFNPKLGPRAYSSGAMLNPESGRGDVIIPEAGIDFKAAEASAEDSEKYTHELVGHILSELSFHNSRNEARKHAMSTLNRLAREDKPALASLEDGVFNSIVLLLLEILGDDDASVRSCSLKVFQEIVRSQPERFKDFMALAILKILEAHKDSVKDVVRAAEDAALTMAELFPGVPCVQVLTPIADTGEFPVNLAAIKMMTKVVEKLKKEEIEGCIEDVVPKLIKGYDNSESSVRKASVFCLVALHQVVGDDLKNHLTSLSGSKMKLLQLYIRRAQAASAASSVEGSPTRTASVSSTDGVLN